MPSDRKRYTTGSPFEASMAYSRAVVQGDWCFVSGVTGYDYETMSLPSDVPVQAEQAFKTIDGILVEAGFALVDIVRVQYTVTDRDDVKRLGPILEKWLGDVRPAATMVIADLIQPEMKFEVEVTAFKG
ncbi:MAG: RidA family protein [Pseudomonadota bacterium]